MKYAIAVLITVGLFVGSAFAELNTSKAELNLANKLIAVKNKATSSASRLAEAKNELVRQVSLHTAVISSGDKTKLQGLDTVVTDAITAIQAVSSYVGDEWPSLE